MFIQEPKTNQPQEGRVSSAAIMDDVRALAEGLERREQCRNGGTRDEARVRLARRVGIMPGTLYTLARNRLKRLDHAVRDRLTAYAIRDLQNEIERLSHDLELARALGAQQAPSSLQAIEQHLTAARALLAETGRATP